MSSMTEVDEALLKINNQLARYTFDGDKTYYAVAVVSGLFSGIINALYVGQMTLVDGQMKLPEANVDNFVEAYAKARGIDKDELKATIAGLEGRFKVAQDNTWNGAGIGVSASDHHLADLAHHPTPIGLMCAVIVQFLRIGIFVNDQGKWSLKFVKTESKDIIEILAPAIITGALNWLVCLSNQVYQEQNGQEMPEGLKKLAHVVASTPMLVEVAKCVDNWFGHLVSDMDGSRATAGEGMGIPGVFLSLLKELSCLPILKDSGLPAFVNDLYVNQRIDLREELCLYKELGKQAIPVIFNEIYTRVMYFACRLGEEAAKCGGLHNINWELVFPFGNRTIDRMLMISSMTFNMANTADAAVHAAIESAGNWIIFSGKFVARFNYVAAGRAALSIVKEVSNEKKEAQLIQEKLILTEVKTEAIVEKFQAYRRGLEERLCDYLTEDITEFLKGFDFISQGAASGDSDLIIKGNVIIQRVLGHEVQFTNQQEFDELMDSDTALIL